MFYPRFSFIVGAVVLSFCAILIGLYYPMLHRKPQAHRSSETIVKKESPFKLLTGGYYTEPTVFQYTQDGKTYLVFRAPEAIAVIEHKVAQ